MAHNHNVHAFEGFVANATCHIHIGDTNHIVAIEVHVFNTCERVADLEGGSDGDGGGDISYRKYL